MPHFSKIFPLASLMVKEYQEQRPQDKLYFKYSTNKPNIIIEVTKEGCRESDFLISFNTDDLDTSRRALKNFYSYMVLYNGLRSKLGNIII